MTSKIAHCVLLADRHHGLTEGVRSLLETMFDAVVMVADETSLAESAARLQPEVAVVDVSHWPLAVPTIYRTVLFSLLVVGFSVIEHVAGALLHGKKPAEGMAELTNTGWHGLLAWYVLVIVAFLPFFTVKEIEAAFGQSKVRGLFFRTQRQQTNSAEDAHRDQPHQSREQQRSDAPGSTPGTARSGRGP